MERVTYGWTKWRNVFTPWMPSVSICSKSSSWDTAVPLAFNATASLETLGNTWPDRWAHGISSTGAWRGCRNQARLQIHRRQAQIGVPVFGDKQDISVCIRADALPSVDAADPRAVAHLSNQIGSDDRAPDRSRRVLDGLLQLHPMLRPFGFCRGPSIRDQNEIGLHIAHLDEQRLFERIRADHDSDLADLGGRSSHALARRVWRLHQFRQSISIGTSRRVTGRLGR